MTGDREVGTGNCVFCGKTICPDVLGSMCAECSEKFEPDPHPNLLIHDDAGEEFLASEEADFKIENNPNYQELNRMAKLKNNRKEKHMVSERNAIRLECLRMALDTCHRLGHFTKQGPEESDKEFVDRFFGDIDEVNIVVDRLMKPFVVFEG